MENKAHALAAGTFVLVVAALLTALALWLTRDDTRYRIYELSSNENVSGLQPQASVRYKGVGVGKVTRIGFDPQTPSHILIEIAVSETTPVSPMTFAALGYQGVTGLAHISLDDAPTAFAALPQGPSGKPRLPLESSPLNKLAEQGPVIFAQVQQATERLNQLLSEDNLHQLQRMMRNIGDAAAQTAQLGQRLERSVTQRLDPALAAVPLLAQESQRTLQALQDTSARTGHAADAWSETAQRLNAPDGTLQRLNQSSEAITRAAHRLNEVTLPRLHQLSDDSSQAMRQVGQAVEELSSNPQALLYGAPLTPAGPGEAGFVPPQPRP